VLSFMYKSILQFNENGIKSIEKITKSFISDGTKMIGDLVMELDRPIQELQRNIIQDILESIDEIYLKDKKRKETHYVERRSDPNTILTTCGEVNYTRTYFKCRNKEGYEYLVDKYAGITPGMRKSQDVVIKSIEHAVCSSYRISGENATNTEDIVSKQAVMKDIHKLEIPAIIPEVKVKKKCKILYINADEDHVSLQFHKKKGDLQEDKLGRKQNTIMPKLIYVFEGVEKESENSKRKKLINKHCFGGVHQDNGAFWEEVRDYINTIYDETYLEKIYIMGDGAYWIKTGLEVLGAKSIFVLDKFHLSQSVTRATAHLGDAVFDARTRIYDSISMEDLDEIKKIFDIIADYPLTTQAKRKQVLQTKGYIVNYWEAITIRNNDEQARMGCSAEGSISHIYSSRLSSRPLGWSKIGVDKMSRLKVYIENGGEVYDLMTYQNIKKERKIEEHIRDQVDKNIRKERHKYCDAFEHTTMALNIGKRTGLHMMTKALRGICG
jgi:hypothetical protein